MTTPPRAHPPANHLSRRTATARPQRPRAGGSRGFRHDGPPDRRHREHLPAAAGELARALLAGQRSLQARQPIAARVRQATMAALAPVGSSTYGELLSIDAAAGLTGDPPRGQCLRPTPPLRAATPSGGLPAPCSPRPQAHSSRRCRPNPPPPNQDDDHLLPEVETDPPRATSHSTPGYCPPTRRPRSRRVLPTAIRALPTRRRTAGRLAQASVAADNVGPSAASASTSAGHPNPQLARA